jgi:DNA-binding transcriptional MerR regulator
MTYTSKELSRKLDLPERTVSVWAERQLLRPSIDEAKGRGSTRPWSENDLKRGQLLRRLIPLLRPELIREIANQFKND